METLKLKAFSQKRNEMLIKGIQASNVERLKVYLRKYHFSQKELVYLCDEICSQSNTSLQLIDLLIEKGLKITHKRYLFLGMIGMKDCSIFKTKHFLKYNHRHNIDLFEYIIINKPQYINTLFDLFNEKTSLIKEYSKRLLILATLSLDLEFIKKLLKIDTSLDINLVKKYSKHYPYPQITTPLYFHRYGALEYLLHNFCNPHYPHYGIKDSSVKPENKENYLISFLDSLKSLGLKFNDSDMLLLISSMNNNRLDLFNYLEKDINPKKIKRASYLKFIIESVAIGFQKPFENLLNQKILKIKESFHLNTSALYKVSDYSHLLIASDGQDNIIKNWNILIDNNYYPKMKKELANILLNLSQTQDKKEHELSVILRAQNCFYSLDNPEEILNKMAKINSIKYPTYLAIKEELEKIIIEKEKKVLESSLNINKTVINHKNKL